MTRIKAGHTVRIRPEYVGLFRGSNSGSNQPGTEFVVTGIRTAEWGDKVGLNRNEEYALGDPEGWGIWLSYLERVV